MFSTVKSKTETGTAEATASRPPRKNSKLYKFWKNNREGWMFVSPLVIGLAIFTVYPMVQSLIWAFYTYTGNRYYFVGFGNFVHMFTVDPYFWKVCGNTCFYAFLSVPIVLIASYLLATLVNLPYKGIGIFRVVYYLPCVIPGIVSGLLWKDIFATNGIFNSLFALFGYHSEFFQSPSMYVAISSIFLMNLWGIGGGMILWLSAFKAIPTQLYEAAKIDGGGVLARFWYITIPMSMPMIFFNVVTMLIGSFQINGTLVYGSNGGKGEEEALYMFGVYIYNEAFVSTKYGYASALSWFLLVFIALLTGLLFFIRGRMNRED